MLSDKKEIIKKENVICEYKKNKLLIYKEEDNLNTIDFNNNCYYRENDEYKIIFNFNDQKQLIHLKKENIDFSQKLIGNIKINDNIINIKYNSSLENKEIIIHLL